MSSCHLGTVLLFMNMTTQKSYRLKKQNITPKLELHAFSLVPLFFLFFQFTPEPDFSSFTSSQKQESNYNVST